MKRRSRLRYDIIQYTIALCYYSNFWMDCLYSNTRNVVFNSGLKIKGEGTHVEKYSMVVVCFSWLASL